MTQRIEITDAGRSKMKTDEDGVAAARAPSRRFESWQCQRCGEAVGWVGRVLDWLFGPWHTCVAPTLAADQYQCSVCDGVFEFGWSEEEAVVELSKNFPGFSKDDCDLVCDDCYRNAFVGAPRSGP